jgi:uncharacterized protein involved in tolerance to divalent cations
MNDFSQIWLACANKEEADKIANTLLIKQLVACAKQIPVSSDFHWQSNLEHSDEILLLMESWIYLRKLKKKLLKFIATTPLF